MKTQIELKDDKFFWEMEKYPGRYNGNPYWALTQDGVIAVVYKDSEGMWRLDPNKGLGSLLFDSELKFTKDVLAQHYVTNKLVKWIKNIISIRI